MTGATSIYEDLSAQEITSLQLGSLRNILAAALETNAFYAPRLRAAHIEPEGIGSLDEYAARVPMVEKSDFIADQEADPPWGARHRHLIGTDTQLIPSTTSGTTGQGVELHFQTWREMQVTCELYSYMFRWSGLGPGDALFLLLPITMMSGGRIEYHGAMASGLTVYTVGNYDIDRKIELIEQLRPAGILANTSYAGRLGTKLHGNPSVEPIRAVVTGGERASFGWMRRLERLWQVRIVDRYGSTQARSDHMFMCREGLGTRDRPGMMHNIDPLILVEVVDPASGRHVADGEVGELVITSLYHNETPLIRCRVGDRAVFHEASYCACGLPFGGVEIASISRTDEMMKIKNVNVWPDAVDDVIFQHDEARDYQVTITSTEEHGDDVHVEVIVDGRAGDLDTLASRLSDELRSKIGITCRVATVTRTPDDLEEVKARRWNDLREHL